MMPNHAPFRAAMLSSLRAGLLLSLTAGAAFAATDPAPLSCMIAPWREARLAFDQPGIVAERHVARTDRVRAGDPLVSLKSGLAEADLERAGLSRDSLAARLSRSEALTRNNVIARDEIEQLRVDHAQAEVEWRAATQRLSRLTLVAPFDGVITSTAVEAGEMAGSEAVMTLAEIARLKAIVILPAEAFGLYKDGQSLKLRSALSGVLREGRVQRIDSFLNPSANSFTLEVALENQDEAFLPGEGCDLIAAQ